MTTWHVILISTYLKQCYFLSLNMMESNLCKEAHSKHKRKSTSNVFQILFIKEGVELSKLERISTHASVTSSNPKSINFQLAFEIYTLETLFQFKIFSFNKLILNSYLNAFIINQVVLFVFQIYYSLDLNK